MARAAKRSVRRAHEQKMSARDVEYPYGLSVILAIGNGVNVASPNGRNKRTVRGKLVIYDDNDAKLAEFEGMLVAGIIKLVDPTTQAKA